MPRVDTDLEVQLVPGGPGMTKALPCEYGPSQHCKWGRCGDCAHRPGGPHDGGNKGPSGFLTRRDGTVIIDRRTGGRPIQILPEHLWTCDCPHGCHTNILTLF
jgi:hypothetical protein